MEGKTKNHKKKKVRFCNALVETGRFDEVHQIYPLRGHSFLPCNRAIGTIKRAKNVIDLIYTAREVAQIISNFFKNFTVQVVNQEDVLNFKQWWPKFYKRSRTTDGSCGRHVPKEDKVQFKITKYNQFSHKKGAVGKVFCKEFIGGIVQAHVFTLRIPAKSYEEVFALPTLPTYTDRIPINIKKLMT